MEEGLIASVKRGINIFYGGHWSKKNTWSLERCVRTNKTQGSDYCVQKKNSPICVRCS